MKLSSSGAELLLGFSDDKTKIRILSELLRLFMNGYEIWQLEFKLNDKKLKKLL